MTLRALPGVLSDVLILTLLSALAILWPAVLSDINDDMEIED